MILVVYLTYFLERAFQVELYTFIEVGDFAFLFDSSHVAAQLV